MNKRSVALALGALSLALGQGAQADTLSALLDAAKTYDAAYLAAQSQAEAVRAQVDQSHALRLPTVNLQGTASRSHLDATEPVSPVLAQFLGQTTNNVNATNRKVGVALRQPLFNRSDTAKMDQAELSLTVSEADLAMADNDLSVRLAQAYFDVLGAQDVLATSQANRRALAEQLASAKRNFDVGNATITDTREAQARHDLAAAQEIAATNDLAIKRLALAQLVGRDGVQPNPLRTPVQLGGLASGNMDDWVSLSLQAPLVRKAETGVQVAKLEISKARAGHLPTLDATAGVARTGIDANSANARASAGTSSSVGLELNMSLFAGFAVQNRIKEVIALETKAERDLDNARRSVGLGTRQAFSGLQSGLAQVKALEAALASAQLALEATQLGYKVGVRVNKDVLDAQTLLASTQKDLFKARYDVIVGSIRLRQVSGVLQQQDITQLDALLGSLPTP